MDKRKGGQIARLINCRFNLKSSVGWCLACVVVSFRQGAMRRNNALLQRIATQQKETTTSYKHHSVPPLNGACHIEKLKFHAFDFVVILFLCTISMKNCLFFY